MPQCKGCGKTGIPIEDLTPVGGKGLVCPECASNAEEADNVVMLREDQPPVPQEKPELEVAADGNGFVIGLTYRFLSLSIRVDWEGLQRAAKNSLLQKVFR
jgi:hypothetical protein